MIWDFSAVSGKINRFYLSQLALTLTFPGFEILARYDLALQTNSMKKQYIFCLNSVIKFHPVQGMEEPNLGGFCE